MEQLLIWNYVFNIDLEVYARKIHAQIFGKINEIRKNSKKLCLFCTPFVTFFVKSNIGFKGVT